MPSVKELKAELEAAGVDYSACSEKEELVQLLEQHIKDAEAAKKAEEDAERQRKREEIRKRVEDAKKAQELAAAQSAAGSSEVEDATGKKSKPRTATAADLFGGAAEVEAVSQKLAGGGKSKISIQKTEIQGEFGAKKFIKP
mmetsp:Transcript_6744/g.15774  ORF Transcript_6744/g.15774 Transcript_6744/m.15774 type:complete len:142 (-) Transcript_6744:340-765(-)